MKSDNTIRNGTSIFVGIIVAIAAFVRGALLLPLLLAQKVDADVLRHPVEPGGERRVKLILRQRPPQLQKHLLRQVERVLGVSRHAPANIIDRFLMQQHQLLKRSRVLRGRSADQAVILQELHPKSLLIPSAIRSISSIVEIAEIFSL
mgnify:CR=1 FL=1